MPRPPCRTGLPLRRSRRVARLVRAPGQITASKSVDTKNTKNTKNKKDTKDTENKNAQGTSAQVVIPAKAGIHFDLSLLKSKQDGFPLARE
jgi:hypothetical protein